MRTYWDLSERERAELTDEQLRAFRDVELMTKGVAKPVPPEPFAEALGNLGLRTVTKFQVCGILFDTAEQCAELMKLRPAKVGYDYKIGYDYKFPEAVEELPTVVTLYTRESVDLVAKDLAEITAKKNAHHAAREAYEKATKAASDATADLYADWQDCRARKLDNEQIHAALGEYVRLADGDRDTAMKFLRKAYGDDAVGEMLEWFGLDAQPAAAMPA